MLLALDVSDAVLYSSSDKINALCRVVVAGIFSSTDESLLKFLELRAVREEEKVFRHSFSVLKLWTALPDSLSRGTFSTVELWGKKIEKYIMTIEKAQ